MNTSLILTTYNRSLYVRDAIESILRQTHKDFELIIWDDGSSDRTLTVAHHYARQDERIKLAAATHKGHAQALIGAHAIAEGNYIGWVDSDDRLAPTALAETVSFLDTHPKVGMVYTNYQTIDENNQVRGIGRRCQIPYSPERLLVDFMTFHFRLMRRSVYEQVGGVDPSFLMSEDYDLCLKISEVASVHHLPYCLYDYRVHKQSISQKQPAEQIRYAAKAVENALNRRGIGDRYRLEVSPSGQFQLKQRFNLNQFASQKG